MLTSDISLTKDPKHAYQPLVKEVIDTHWLKPRPQI